MDKKIRRAFFYALILVFVVLGSYLLVTAQGWVLDIKNFRVVKTGALFLKYAPSDASIKINDELSNASPGLFSTGVFISKLIPGEYSVTLSKAGFSPWVKDLSVREELVTAESQIELWPSAFPMTPVATSSVSDFWLTGQGAVLQLGGKTLEWNNGALRGQTVVLSDPGSGIIVTSDGKNEFLTDLNRSRTAVNLLALFDSLRQSQTIADPSAPIGMFYHPFSAGKLLIATKNALYSLDAARNTLERLSSASSTIQAVLSGNDVFLENKNGKVTVFDLLLRTESSFNPGLEASAAIKTTPSGSLAFFAGSDGSLSAFDRSTNATTTLENNVSDFFVSPDEKRLVSALQNGGLSITALADYYVDLPVKKGDRWTIPLNNGFVGDFVWLPDFPNYGLALSGGKLSIVELDSRQPQNISSVADEVKKFTVQGNDVYILKSDGTLLKTSLK